MRTAYHKHPSVRSRAGLCLLAGLAALLGAVSAPPRADAALPGVNWRIAFTSDRDGNAEIYNMEPDGSGQTRWTTNAAIDEFPAWGPPGTQLPGGHPQRIAFSSNREGNAEIYATTGPFTPTNLTLNAASDSDPAWSPDGGKLAFVSDRDGDADIYTMNLDGSGLVNLTDPDPGANLQPNWSPNGTKIAFVAFPSPGDPEISVVNADGSGATTLTANSSTDVFPNWSRDGARIAFTTNRDGNDEIYTMKADGTDPTNLTNNAALDDHPAWSPDGTMIAFHTTRDGNSEIYTMKPDGTGPLNRSSRPSSGERMPDWQPAQYVRPLGAARLRAPLVPAYLQCGSPNRTHGPSLAFPSCNPPVQTSPTLTVGTPDADGAPANSIGSVRLSAVVGTPGPPEDSDLRISVSITDVRCRTGSGPACGSANAAGGPDYSGEVQETAVLRLTDRSSSTLWGSSFVDAATVEDADLSVTVACAATASVAVGGTCSTSTSVNALFPGSVLDTRRAIWQLGEAKILDGGPDGVVATVTGNALFAKQGLFVP